MKKIMSLAVITALGLGFTGCGNTNPMPIGNNVYTISGDRPYVYQESYTFCNTKNMKSKPIREGKTNNFWVGELKTLDFKCLNENSKEYKQNTKYEVSKDITIESNVKVENK